jgi:hypothetical protein
VAGPESTLELRKKILSGHYTKRARSLCIRVAEDGMGYLLIKRVFGTRIL